MEQERVRIDSNGKFGLGTNNPQALLDVEQTTQGEVARFRASNSTRYLKISSFDSGFNGSGFDFNATSNTGEISFSTEDVEKVRIDNDGNFGIGTNNPSHKLDVVGNTQLYGTLVIGDNTDISPTANGAGQLHIDANGYTPYIAADGTAMYVGHNSTSRDLRLQTNETDRLTIDGSTGNIGINTDAPTAKLNVVTTSTDDVILMLEADMGTNNNRTLQFKSPATDSAADPFLIQTGNSIQFRIDSTNALKINDNSNVGIGEESPDVRLHVKEQFDIAYSLANVADEANHLLKLENPSTTANAFSGMQFRVGSGADMFFGAIQHSVNHGDFFFANQNSPQREMMRIKSTGQVGVNQTTWSNKNHMFEVKQSTNDKEIARFLNAGSGSVQGKGYVGLSVFNATTYPHAWIGVEEDNNGSYLGHLTFSTRSVSSDSAPEERLRITAEGDMGLGNAGCSNPGGDPGGLVGATVFEIRQTTSGSITSGNNRAGAVLRLKHEAQWENGYGNTNTTNLDDLGRIEFLTGDASLGEGVRSRIRCTNNLYYQNQALTFEVAGSNSATVNEVMRLTASGTLLVGRTSNYNSSPYETAVLQGNQHNLVLFQGTNSNYTNCIMRNSYANYSGNNVSGNMITFHDHGGTERGKIAIDGSSTSYITSSDYRLKENIVDMSNGITRFKQLSPRRFNWIEHPGTTVDGFIAHEVSPIVPEAVNGEKDAVDGEGNPVYQGVDNSKLVPLLAGALQEAITKIESLEARIAALES